MANKLPNQKTKKGKKLQSRKLSKIRNQGPWLYMYAEEIKKMYSMNCSKTPRLDSYTSGFFQKTKHGLFTLAINRG
jgi:hypothetical protein